jgi:hypothetical protein
MIEVNDVSLHIVSQQGSHEGGHGRHGEERIMR